MISAFVTLCEFDVITVVVASLFVSPFPAVATAVIVYVPSSWELNFHLLSEAFVRSPFDNAQSSDFLATNVVTGSFPLEILNVTSSASVGILISVSPFCFCLCLNVCGAFSVTITVTVRSPGWFTVLEVLVSLNSTMYSFLPTVVISGCLLFFQTAVKSSGKFFTTFFSVYSIPFFASSLKACNSALSLTPLIVFPSNLRSLATNIFVKSLSASKTICFTLTGWSDEPISAVSAVWRK